VACDPPLSVVEAQLARTVCAGESPAREFTTLHEKGSKNSKGAKPKEVHQR
jgi:hypothetical protein